MNIGAEAKNILVHAERISNRKIINREDFLRLTELALQNSKMELLKDISFHAKYSQGLINIIQKRDDKIDENYFRTVQDEFSRSIAAIKKQLEILLENSDNFFREIFSEKYMQITQGSLTNLNNLCSDLGYLKMYFNDLKRKEKSKEDL